MTKKDSQQLEQLKIENEQLRQQSAQQQAQYQALINSTSWKITGPFRNLKENINQLNLLNFETFISRMRRNRFLAPLKPVYRYIKYRQVKAASQNVKQPPSHSQPSGTQTTPMFDLDSIEQRPSSSHPLFQQIFNYAKGVHQPYKEIAQLPVSCETNPLKYIAFYLPQYHPIAENDEWWGKGFTEWTNVSKAVPQFKEHYQPRLPGELGYYDLRIPEVMQRQIELANLYGLHGFCFHHYWFGGKRLLELPFKHVLEHPEWPLNYCLCWANENWTRRWDGLDNEVLIAQQHSPEDDIAFMRDILPALKDPRYIKVNNKPLLILYRPSLLPDARATGERWREFCRSEGVGEIYLVMARVFNDLDPRPYGFDAAVEFPPHDVAKELLPINSELAFFNHDYQGTVYDYTRLVESIPASPHTDYPLIRTAFPSWDNDARKPGRGDTFAFATPDSYQNWLYKISQYALENPVEGEHMVFINAWNEWGEGAYLEPDREYGYAYLDATAQVLRRFSKKTQRLIAKTQVNEPEKHHDTVVVLHLYYPELWAEISSYIKNIKLGVDLYISLPLGIDSRIVEQIIAQFPEVRLYQFDNRGRDIAPFIAILQQILPLNYQSLLKIHSKKSQYSGNGALWRQELYQKLLTEPDKIIRQLKEPGNVGLVAPEGFLVPLKKFKGSNDKLLHTLAKKMSLSIDERKAFVAGSMFWCQPSLLQPLIQLGLHQEDFPLESGQRDGTLAHALERVIAFVIYSQGKKIIEM